ncbi:YMGG-like glycine zipper-containing protein [Rhizobium sp. L1K21]|uniref:YMGG-like glycine zipper-containing protein n=1 Tax=Rhizobium sp. L1K21 TaxID=2954933 RepID=UPI00209234C6|nr:YMGG-like glycine zipper-containing protein [Rhizobium sp. L1K21]MCO6188578.1 YMGG-like glycine zipper-containing protein [Rhizobium sp. L1K21]
MKIIGPATIVLLAGLAGCSQTERGAAIGGASGAAVGGIVSGNVQGAAVGGAVGAVAGALIGQANEPGQCYYRDRYGDRYVADCP